MNSDLLYSTLEIGFIYGLIAIGVYLTLRIVDFPDLTINGSFALGAVVSTKMIISGYSAVVATAFAFTVGGLAGAITAFLNLQCHIQNLLAGIIVMIGLHSVNFRIMGKPNLVLLHHDVIFGSGSAFLVIALIVICLVIAISYFLLSEIGLGLRASGQNSVMGSAYGVSYASILYITLILSNGLTALAGSLLSQLQGFCDIGMGNGIIVIGLASVVIGERMITTRNIMMIIASCLVGAVLYNLLIAVSLDLADSVLKASDIYLITSVLIVVIMLRNSKNRMLKQQLLQ